MAEKSTLSILLYSGSYSDVLELLRTVWLYPAPHPIALGIKFESKGSREPKQLIAQHSDPSIIAGDSLGWQERLWHDQIHTQHTASGSQLLCTSRQQQYFI